MISNLENSETVLSEVIGDNIKKLRLASRLSRQDLAHQMGISYQQLYKYEQGQNRISAVNIVYLKYLLNADYHEFFEGLF